MPRLRPLDDEEHGDTIAAVSAAIHLREIARFIVDEVGGRRLPSSLNTNDKSEDDLKQGYAVSSVF
jgi:hypothetical protein